MKRFGLNLVLLVISCIMTFGIMLIYNNVSNFQFTVSFVGGALVLFCNKIIRDAFENFCGIEE